MRFVFGLVLTLVTCGSCLAGPRNIDDVLERYGPDVRQRLAPYKQQLPQGFEPKNMKLVALKASRLLEVWLKDPNIGWHQLRTYPIAKASGSLRPKMRRGDLLVPEGIYRLEAANPNSKYHLSLKLNYPNDIDRRFAEKEQRDDPGDNIFIHGRDVSHGCLAMGDESIEDLFILAHDVGLNNIEVVISPWDPRELPLKKPTDLPDWVNEKYQAIEASLSRLSPATELL